MTLPASDIVQEARRIIQTAAGRAITLRLLGGLAVRLHSPSADHRALSRSYPDIDFATPRSHSRRVEQLFIDLGYAPDKAFNTLNGAERMIFYDRANGRRIDVFVGSFAMCHRLPIAERMAVDPLTLPLAELFLTKLQIVELNEKDVRDLYALLLDHPVGSSDDETTNARRIARLCARDWGLYKTVSLNIERLRQLLPAYSFTPTERTLLLERLDALRAAIEREPKSMRWRLRARLGERVRWYELPEDIGRHDTAADGAGQV